MSADFYPLQDGFDSWLGELLLEHVIADGSREPVS